MQLYAAGSYVHATLTKHTLNSFYFTHAQQLQNKNVLDVVFDDLHKSTTNGNGNVDGNGEACVVFVEVS